MDLLNLFKKKRIFLDYASATPVLREVRWAMWRYLTWDFYNPNAIYQEGERVREVVEECRTKIARILGVAKEGVIFTSGGTEANTWALRGVDKGTIVVDSESHPSVLDSTEGLETLLWQKDSLLPIDKSTVLISTPIPNNKLGRQVREWRKKQQSDSPLLHIDASQSAQYFDVGLETLACDMLTLDSAKLYGPKGIGALVLRRGVKLSLPPQGTPAVPLIVGFTKALEIAARDKDEERARLSSLSTLFAESLQQEFPEAVITQTLPNIVNVSIPNILPELLVLALDKAGVMVSAGPACNSNKPEPPETPVRISIGRQTSEKEVKKAIKIFCLTVKNVLN